MVPANFSMYSVFFVKRAIFLIYKLNLIFTVPSDLEIGPNLSLHESTTLKQKHYINTQISESFRVIGNIEVYLERSFTRNQTFRRVQAKQYGYR